MKVYRDKYRIANDEKESGKKKLSLKKIDNLKVVRE